MLERNVILAAALLVLPCCAFGQEVRTHELIGRLRTEKSAEYAVAEAQAKKVMRQQVDASPASRVELARGLRDIALSHPDPAKRVSAVTLISIAAIPGQGVPYDGSLPLLIELYQTSKDVGVRGTALMSLAEIADRKGGFAFLRSVMDSESPPEFRDAALYATRALLVQGGADGRHFVAQLHKAGQIKNPAVVRWLDVLAKNDYRTK